MSKPNAAIFAAQGSKFLGTPYKEMDCQAFVEAMLREVGVKKNYSGSNDMYRDCYWVGTPEEARKRFGSVPVGALLFIWNDKGGERARGYFDGLGDAEHVGVKTGTGLGAIHSSSTRKCVAESEFHDKTIPNGGWNRVGLFNPLDYGIDSAAINQPSSTPHAGQTSTPSAQPSVPTVTSSTTATVRSDNGKSVKMRQKPSASCNLYWDVPCGSSVTVRGPENGGWTPIHWNGRDGYMMSDFLSVNTHATVPPIVQDAPEQTVEPTGYALTLFDLSLEQAQELAALYPANSPQIEPCHG